MADPLLEPEDPLEPEVVLPAAPELVEVPLIPAAPVVGVIVAGEPATTAGLPAAPEGVAPLLFMPAAVGGVGAVALAPAAAGVVGDVMGVVEPAAPPPGAADTGGSIVRVASSDPQPAPKAIATNAAAAMLNADR